MNIVVLVKHTPDTQSVRRIENGRLVRGEDDTLNEIDEHAIEAALTLKEQVGGQVVAVSMGPADAKSSLLRALQMGADRAVLVSDAELAGADAPQTARALAGAIRALLADDAADAAVASAVFTGVASSDGMTSLLPGALASALGWPVLTGVSALETDATSASAHLTLPGGELRVQANWPAVISVSDELNRPRHPGFKDMMAAKKKPLETFTLAQLVGAQVPGAFPQGANMSLETAASQRERILGPDSHVVNWRMLDAREQEERGEGTILANTGGASEKLAQYLKSEGFGA